MLVDRKHLEAVSDGFRELARWFQSRSYPPPVIVMLFEQYFHFPLTNGFPGSFDTSVGRYHSNPPAVR